MYAIIEGDLITGRTTVAQSHGIKLDGESYRHFRFDGNELVDISTLGLTVFYVDSDGIKHISESDSWQLLECHYDDALILDGDLWRVRNSSDDYDDLLFSALSNREAAYKAESDPLYMEWQYDQTDKAEKKWRDKVAEIKERLPLPTE